LLLASACSTAHEDGGNGDQGSAELASAEVMPCAVAGGDCVAATECGRGVGSIGSSKYNCGGRHRVCCFTKCGSSAEDFECCNAEHTYAPRPVCNDAQLSCAGGEAKVPVQSCVAAPAK
jgi:hypothetical protein